MYALVGIVAGGIGLALLIVRHSTMSFLSYPTEEPILAGIVFSVWFALGVMSLAGLRSPLKFTLVLVVEVFYKTVWIISTIVPMAIAGTLTSFGSTTALLYLVPIIGNSIVIPWGYFSAK
jgi:hypothetical protein